MLRIIISELELTCPGILEGEVCIQEEGAVRRDYPGDESPMEEPADDKIRKDKKVTREDPTDYDKSTKVSETDSTRTMAKTLSNDPTSCVKMVKGRPMIVRDAGVYEKMNEELLVRKK